MQEVLDDGNIISSSEKKYNGKPIFRSSEIKFYNDSVKLIRNKFPYEEISYKEISYFIIREGYVLRNRITLLSISVLLIFVSLYSLIKLVLEFIKSPDLILIFNRGAVLTFWGPLFLLGMGSYIIFYSRKRTKIVILKKGEEIIQRRIKEIEEAKQIIKLKEFLENKLHGQAG